MQNLTRLYIGREGAGTKNLQPPYLTLPIQGSTIKSPSLHLLVNNALYEVEGNAAPQLNAAFLDGHKEVISAEGSPRPFGLIVTREYPWLLVLWLAALLLGSGFDELNLLLNVIV